jgi:signal transduction histidine kinase
LKISFTKSNGGAQSPASLFAALVLAALVPAVCVLWFMTVAMRNERLAVQERFTDVYLNHVAAIQRQLTAHWKERQAALQSAGRDSPAETFAAIVRSNLADSVVVHDGRGNVLYPRILESPPEENGDWAAARELEFQKKDYPAAVEAYLRIAKAAPDIHMKARALQSAAGCLLKAGEKTQAVQRLTELSNDPSLRQAVSPQGTLIVPNAQLLILKLLASPEAGGTDFSRHRTLDDLVGRLDDYSDADLSSNQRRFLMGEVKALAPNIAPFSTLAAEELAAEYLEHNPAPPMEPKLQRAPLAKTWRLASPDRTIVSLFLEDRLRMEMTALIDSLALPSVRVTLLPPGEPFASNNPIPTQDASEVLPGWQLGLSFLGADPLATASARQARFYLWTGCVVVLIIAMVSLLVARFVGAQMRLARLKNELVSTVSHELRTPLASMRALVDTLIAGRFRGEQQLQEYLRLIARENLRLCQLIENFLAFSRMERGKQRFQFEDLAPLTVVQTAIEALKERLEEPHCRFELCVPSSLPQIHGDAEALTTVLINLLDNACKYTMGDRRIVARAYAVEGRRLCFEVGDNGIGLTAAETRRIFDRFYQVDQSLTRQNGGCGLGLSIVKRIVDAHGGTVEVTSEPGKGSLFRVSIPLAGPITARRRRTLPNLDPS